MSNAIGNITIQDMYIHDLSSNAIRAYGQSTSNWAYGLLIENVIMDSNCCKYLDYLLPGGGNPVPGASGVDQGQILIYNWKQWTINGCTILRSASDNTHIRQCDDGTFENSVIDSSKMGGLFIDQCTNAVFSNLQIQYSGSRGISVESGLDTTLYNRGQSSDLVFSGCSVIYSGREGLYVVSAKNINVGNCTFAYSGQKHDGFQTQNIWLYNQNFAADTMMNIDIHDNTLTTGDGQLCEGETPSNTPIFNIVIHSNILNGPTTCWICHTYEIGDTNVTLRDNVSTDNGYSPRNLCLESNHIAYASAYPASFDQHYYNWHGFNVQTYTQPYASVLLGVVPPDSNATFLLKPTSAGNYVAEYILVQPNTKYTLSWYAALTSGGNTVKYGVNDATNMQTIIGPTDYSKNLNTASSTRMSVTFTTPPSCYVINIPVTENTNFSNGLSDGIWVGKVQLEAGESASEYQDRQDETAYRATQTLGTDSLDGDGKTTVFISRMGSVVSTHFMHHMMSGRLNKSDHGRSPRELFRFRGSAEYYHQLLDSATKRKKEFDIRLDSRV